MHAGSRPVRIGEACFLRALQTWRYWHATLHNFRPGGMAAYQEPWHKVTVAAVNAAGEGKGRNERALTAHAPRGVRPPPPQPTTKARE